jgi:hypothetical protein
VGVVAAVVVVVVVVVLGLWRHLHSPVQRQLQPMQRCTRQPQTQAIA